jgi:serine/threonine-protein kinase
LYVRSLDKDDGHPLSGTEGGSLASVSPDGRWVAYWVDDEIRKVPFAGGPSETVTAASSMMPTRLSWTESGDLVFDTSDGIHRAGPSGQRSLTHTTPHTQHILPLMLPGDRTLLYTSRRRDWSWVDDEIVALDTETSTTRVLLPDADDPRYLPDGHLLFLRRGKLFAVPFDPVTAEVRGAPAAILDGVAEALSGGNVHLVTGAGQFAVSSTGALAWVPGAPVPYPEASIVAINRRGTIARVRVPVRSYGPMVRVSPDGHLLGLNLKSLSANLLCVYDLRRGTLTTLTHEGEAGSRAWISGGNRLVFTSNFRGRPTLELIKADGSGGPITLADEELDITSWWEKGHSLVLSDHGQIRLLSVEGDKVLFQPPLVTAPSAQAAELSPDGHWLAYEAWDGAGPGIFVQQYPGPGPRVPIATRGSNPAWNPRGDELFFLGPSTGDPDWGRLMVVQVREQPTFTVSVATPVFDADTEKFIGGCGPWRCYDISPDGQTFYEVRYAKTVGAAPVTHINLVLNWLDELKERVPGASR